jgi:hypothetical protein
MADVTTDYQSQSRGQSLVVNDVATANTTILNGIMLIRTTSTGLIMPASDSATASTFAGWSKSHVTANGGTDNPVVSIEQKADRLMDCYDTLTQADVGRAAHVYVKDNHTVAATGSTSHTIDVGIIVPPFVSANKCWVRPTAAA